MINPYTSMFMGNQPSLLSNSTLLPSSSQSLQMSPISQNQSNGSTYQSQASQSFNNPSISSLMNGLIQIISMMMQMMQALEQAMSPQAPLAAQQSPSPGYSPQVMPDESTQNSLPSQQLTSSNSPPVMPYSSIQNSVDANNGVPVQQNAGTANGGSAISMTPADNPYFNYQQGQVGDCGVLSTISAIANTPDGQNILNNSVHSDGKGGYNVTLQGTGQTYDVSQSQLQDPNLSKGSTQVKALEVAIQQHYGENDSNFVHSATDIFPLLTGKQSTFDGSQSASEIKNKLTSLASSVDAHTTAVEVGANSLPDSPTQGGHGYTVSAIDPTNNTITYENPWNANQQVTVNLDQFSQDVASSPYGVTYESV